MLEVRRGQSGEVSFSLEYHDGPPVFLCGLLHAGAPELPAPALACARLDERGATLRCSGADADADAPPEQASWLALPVGKLWALDAYEHASPE